MERLQLYNFGKFLKNLCEIYSKMEGFSLFGKLFSARFFGLASIVDSLETSHIWRPYMAMVSLVRAAPPSNLRPLLYGNPSMRTAPRGVPSEQNPVKDTF